MSTNSPLSPSRSVESGLDKTPMRRGANVKNDDWVFATPEKPSLNSSKNNRKVLGSIERGLDKMKNMLTPRKHRHSSNGEGPGTVHRYLKEVDCSSGQFKSAKLKYIQRIHYKCTKFLHNTAK